MKKTINLRVDIELKLSLQVLANEQGSSLSDYIRDIIIFHIEESNFENLEPVLLIKDETNDPKITAFETTYQFTCLLTWLFCRHINPVENNSKEVILGMKTKVEKAIEQSSFSHELRLEFLKVLSDLNRFILEPDYENKQFLFTRPGSNLSFNYYQLMNEIWSLENKES
ncbi:MAG: hypothetical protein COA50_00190 [Flavobacteriaceae bacterium]|nr:MAG: hypothetical protein COA50_00190 [Flavobacteriaceae bacterium]